MPKASSPLDLFSRPTREYVAAALGAQAWRALGPFLAEAGFSLGARGWMRRMDRLLATGADDDG